MNIESLKKLQEHNEEMVKIKKAEKEALRKFATPEQKERQKYRKERLNSLKEDEKKRLNEDIMKRSGLLKKDKK